MSDNLCQSCRALGAATSLSFGFHRQSNSQTERMNPHLVTALWCECLQQVIWRLNLRLPQDALAKNHLNLFITQNSPLRHVDYFVTVDHNYLLLLHPPSFACFYLGGGSGVIMLIWSS